MTNFKKEYACEECGTPLMTQAALSLGHSTPPALNQCNECGHETPAGKMFRFQWEPRLASLLDGLCTIEEQKQLRLNPVQFIKSTLNQKLHERGKPPVEVDTSSTPVTIYIKNMQVE